MSVGRLIVEQERQVELSAAAADWPADREWASPLVADLLNAMPYAVAIACEGRVLHINSAFTELFGYTAAEAVGQELDALVVPDGRFHENELIDHALRRDCHVTIESMRQTSTGDQVAVSIRVARVRLRGGAQAQLASYRDIRQEKQEAERLRYTAAHDGLTGLPNRVLFLERVQLMLDRLRRRPDRGFAVVFLDLDGFKRVNDTLGHPAGDALLLEIAQRLRQTVRPQDLIARFGGDEFALLLDECAEPSEVALVAERIQAQIKVPVLIDGAAAHVSASMGIMLAVTAGEQAAEVLAHADHAMYEAKAQGKARAVIYAAPVIANASGGECRRLEC